ncbi:MAG: magnesium chelatase subunit D [Acidibrevibacterium sp.]|uniref:magnesium chelatase subunit D n=1 Tax=Acidibrevibacterium sp. TaxID=2606776 RepID=UPI003D0616AF
MTAKAAWADASLAIRVFAIAPSALGGIAVRAAAGPVRERWLAELRTLLPATTPLRRLPPGIDDARLLGGLDLVATLACGRPRVERGLLAEADHGVVLVPMAERLSPGTAARLSLALDTGEVALERDGLARRLPARIGVIALDEGIDADERLAACLADRLAFHLDLTALSLAGTVREPHDPQALAAASEIFPRVVAGEGVITGLCEAAFRLGIGAPRATLLALRAARALAALAGRDTVAAADAAAAARLVLAPRAAAPAAAPEPPADQAERRAGEESVPPHPPPPDDASPKAMPDLESQAGAATAEQVVAAVEAALPAGLLARLHPAEGGVRRPPGGAGRAGTLHHARQRGRAIGVENGDPRAGRRLSLIETLRAAAPWQRLRAAAAGAPAGKPRRLFLTRTDFRVIRFRQPRQSTTIFAVDASGSAALHRLGEAKGAVECLLADCYVRRDQVALIAFRGRAAEIVLPPTGALARARRSLAACPGGGATPLAAGIDAARQLALAEQRRGRTPVLVLLTDGRANIGRDGTSGRSVAEADALAAARALRAMKLAALLVDTAPRPQPLTERLAGEMGAAYLALPHVEPERLSAAARAASAGVR